MEAMSLMSNSSMINSGARVLGECEASASMLALARYCNHPSWLRPISWSRTRLCEPSLSRHLPTSVRLRGLDPRSPAHSTVLRTAKFAREPSARTSFSQAAQRRGATECRGPARRKTGASNSGGSLGEADGHTILKLLRSVSLLKGIQRIVNEDQAQRV
jgi:hypothetical protein